MCVVEGLSERAECIDCAIAATCCVLRYSGGIIITGWFTSIIRDTHRKLCQLSSPFICGVTLATATVLLSLHDTCLDGTH